jgi:hypothetical protein
VYWKGIGDAIVVAQRDVRGPVLLVCWTMSDGRGIQIDQVLLTQRPARALIGCSDETPGRVVPAGFGSAATTGHLERKPSRDFKVKSRPDVVRLRTHFSHTATIL